MDEEKAEVLHKVSFCLSLYWQSLLLHYYTPQVDGLQERGWGRKVPPTVKEGQVYDHKHYLYNQYDLYTLCTVIVHVTPASHIHSDGPLSLSKLKILRAGAVIFFFFFIFSWMSVRLDLSLELLLNDATV